MKPENLPENLAPTSTEALSLTKATAWIPVAARLPEPKQDVLFSALFGKHAETCFGFVTSEDEWYDVACTDRDGEPARTYDVTHWMPLPDPPDTRDTLQSAQETNNSSLTTCIGLHTLQSNSQPSAVSPAQHDEGYVRDALRYRWLRDRPSLIGWDWWPTTVHKDVLITPEFMDAAIDAAAQPDSKPE